MQLRRPFAQQTGGFHIGADMFDDFFRRVMRQKFQRAESRRSFRCLALGRGPEHRS